MNLDVGAPVSQTKLTAVTAAAIKACDGLDGVIDGVISDPRQCRFDPHALVCGRPGAPTDGTCLSSPEADAVQQIWARPARHAIASSCGTDLSGAHPLPAWQTCHPTRRQSLPMTLTLDHWRLWIEQNPSFDLANADHC